MRIHPTALVEDGARLGSDCVIHAHAIITRHVVLGEGVVVHPFAVIGGDPQDLGFQPATESGVVIGDRTVLREHVTVNRATQAGGATRIGADCYLMATAHVAHDGQVGDRVILANQVLLAGHVHVGERACMGGGAAVHQFCRIGESAMIGGLTRLTRDVPPYCMTTERDELIGLNAIGLRRRGFTPPVIAEVRRAFHAVCRALGNPRALAAAAVASGDYQHPETLRFLDFFASGKRGFVRPRAGTEDSAA
jgi:UDP-N-acetylglucosamine acyltransferase